MITLKREAAITPKRAANEDLRIEGWWDRVTDWTTPAGPNSNSSSSRTSSSSQSTTGK
jgi:hypothetical protein